MPWEGGGHVSRTRVLLDPLDVVQSLAAPDPPSCCEPPQYQSQLAPKALYRSHPRSRCPSCRLNFHTCPLPMKSHDPKYPRKYKPFLFEHRRLDFPCRYDILVSSKVASVISDWVEHYGDAGNGCGCIDRDGNDGGYADGVDRG